MSCGVGLSVFGGRIHASWVFAQNALSVDQCLPQFLFQHTTKWQPAAARTRMVGEISFMQLLPTHARAAWRRRCCLGSGDAAFTRVGVPPANSSLAKQRPRRSRRLALEMARKNVSHIQPERAARKGPPMPLRAARKERCQCVD